MWLVSAAETAPLFIMRVQRILSQVKERKMTSPSISTVETTGPWQGSLSGTGLPDNSDDGAVIIAAEQAAGATGILVSYADGQFTSRFWSAARRFRC